MSQLQFHDSRACSIARQCVRALVALGACCAFIASIAAGAIPARATTVMAPMPANTLQQPVEPANTAAMTTAIKVKVAQAGIHRITGAELLAVGFDLANSPASRLRLDHNGQEIALEIRSAQNDRLAPTSEVRFYADEPGDRWNANDIYWLTVQPTAGKRMEIQPVGETNGTAQTVGLETGKRSARNVYQSGYPGPDQDHWYVTQLSANTGAPQTVFTMTLPGMLAPVGGVALVSVWGATATEGQHILRAQIGNATSATTWAGSGNWTQTLSLTLSAGSRQFTLTLASPAADSVLVDAIEWQLPVSLNFAGQGGAFRAPATSRYQLSNIPADGTLYEVDATTSPRILNIPTGTSVLIENEAGPRQYVLAGPGAIYAPALSPHMPLDLSAERDGEVVYIAPPSLRAALAPLVALRQSQGLSVKVIEPRWIYDAWSYGHVSPNAIRNFLRYARSTWARPPRYVTLIGDGTFDPLGFADTSANNLASNVIPPYMAMVDVSQDPANPAVSESACETCYGLLDGDDPLADSTPDIAIARLPARTPAELSVMVSKIISYETAPLPAAWRSQVGFVSDNALDEQGRLDSAGDFNTLLDMAAALQPAGLAIQRMYYDPYPPSANSAPWREPHALAAYTRTLDLFNSGAGIIEFAGHGHPLQFASTAPFQNPYDNAPASYLLSSADPDRMTNTGRLPIALFMACSMGRFHVTPATSSGQTLAERLVSSPNGAVAVWASSGKGVLWGHQYLQRGFYTALWSAAPFTARLGDLILAGQRDLIANADFLAYMSWNYLVLGDAATLVRVAPASTMPWTHQTFLPSINK